MKPRPRLITLGLALLVLVIAGALLMRHSLRGKAVFQVTGPLNSNDVAEISKLVLSQRAPLLPGHFASPKDAAGVERSLRERLAGELRSIASDDGKTAVVAFTDKWDAKLGYDYDLERTPAGWRIIGVGWRRGATNE